MPRSRNVTSLHLYTLSAEHELCRSRGKDVFASSFDVYKLDGAMQNIATCTLKHLCVYTCHRNVDILVVINEAYNNYIYVVAQYVHRL